MFTKYILPLLAAAGLAFAVYTVVQARQPTPPAKPLVQPPVRTTVFAHEIAGAGLVEAKRENIPLGALTQGVVMTVHVKYGDMVRKGDPLFTIDDRPLRAELRVREAMLAAAEADLHKLLAMPRKEDVPVSRAAVEEAEANLKNAEVTMERARRNFQQGAETASVYDSARYAHSAYKATLTRVKADYDRLMAGAWKEDIAIARTKVEQVRAQVESIKTDLERATTRAPIDGQVLQVNVRPGQFAAVVWKEPLIVMGEVDQLNVRIDIDEHDLAMFKPGAPAVASLRGYPKVRFPLTFVRVQPYVIPKASLTGDNSERVDTRVLQVIYALPEKDKRPLPVFVGQQMDVYLEAVPPPDSKPSGPSEDASPTRARAPLAAR
jgi:HlyD family secretion protein